MVCNALGKRAELCVSFRSEGEGERVPVPSCPVPSRRRYAVAQRLQAERELGAAAARRLGGSPGLRWPSVLHRPQHPANFVDRPERQVPCERAYAGSLEQLVPSIRGVGELEEASVMNKELKS